MPGESVFVGSQEIVHLPNTLAASVMLRNSHICQDLSSDVLLFFLAIRPGFFPRDKR